MRYITTYVVVSKIDIQTESTRSDVGDRLSDMIRCSVSRSRFWGKRRNRFNAESTFFGVNGRRRVLWYLRHFLPAPIIAIPSSLSSSALSLIQVDCLGRALVLGLALSSPPILSSLLSGNDAFIEAIG